MELIRKMLPFVNDGGLGYGDLVMVKAMIRNGQFG